MNSYNKNKNEFLSLTKKSKSALEQENNQIKTFLSNFKGNEGSGYIEAMKTKFIQNTQALKNIKTALEELHPQDSYDDYVMKYSKELPNG